MNKFSNQFRELWSNGNRSLDIEKYELCLSELQSAHDKRTMIQWSLAILFFGAGLWALYFSATFIAVALLIFAGYCNLNSANHILMSEIMNTHRLLAMLVNKHTRDLEEIRRELMLGKDSKSS
jgi:hypothetical protein